MNRKFTFCFLSSLCLLFLCSCVKPLYKNTFVISGTFLEIISPYKEAGRIVYGEFNRLDKIFNFYQSDSQLSQLNKTHHKPFKVSGELIEVLGLAQEVYQLSEGAFDVSYGTLYKFWKRLMKKDKLKEFPSTKIIEELRQKGGMENLQINPQQGTVLIKKEGLSIDLGGIAKGYIVDKAVLKLREKGIDSALINAGGDIYCLGRNRDKPWRVGIRNPNKELGEVVGREILVDEAIATSGNYEQFFEYNGERYSHLIDPRTGYPVKNNILSVSVISKNCTTTDGLATAFFVMGLEGIDKFLSRVPSTMRIFVVIQDKKGKHLRIFKN